MNITIGTTKIDIELQYLQGGRWVSAFGESGNPVSIALKEHQDYVDYAVTLNSEEETKVRLSASPVESRNAFHVIPCCIYGDNNAAEVHAGEFPLLCEEEGEDVFRASRWEFRADRAAMPLSAICTEKGVLAVTVDPYTLSGSAAGTSSANMSWNAAGKASETAPVSVVGKASETAPVSAAGNASGTEVVPNGVFAELPNICGISVGYTNDPISFINKRTPGPSTEAFVSRGEVKGRIYFVPARDADNPRLSLHEIIRREYALRHERSAYQKSFRDAVKGCLRSFAQISWNPETEEYTNCNCLPPENPVLHPWRNVKEIGWTGGGVLAYPLVLAGEILGEEGEKLLSGAAAGGQMFDKITSVYHEDSGLLFDLTSPIDTDRVKDRYNGASGLAHQEVSAADENGRWVNGWWAEFGLARDVHCAYTVGSAVHYLLKTIDFLTREGKSYPENWLDKARKTIDTVILLQREDGAFGYTYRTDRKEVADWNGFAGCWFVPCAAYLYHLTGEEKYLQAADKALDYYGEAVRTLTCNGTPMDTWKSPDEEGNLAYIRGARLLHEYTGREKYLTALKNGADYEFLWRYGYRTKPMYKPIADGWNACGGSITSVSNPHIHPMGMIVDSDLYYLGKVSGDSYYTERALDGTAWIMQTLELYPEKTGYGQYGVLSERWCPSDGLVIQKDSNGDFYSSWYSYNLWAAAAAFEEVCERCLDDTELSMCVGRV